MNVGRRFFSSLILFLSILFVCEEQTDARYFYKGYAYGTQGEYNPFYLLMNGSFDIVQSSNRNNEIRSLQYGTGGAKCLREHHEPTAERQLLSVLS